MYDDLIKKLRHCGNAISCLHCPYWEGCGGSKEDLTQAADAIEELQAQLMYSNDAAKAIAEKVPKWIPVTERLPEKSGDYLVFDDCGNLYVNEWHCPLKKWQYCDSRITHWMPLPPIPKED